MKFLRAQLRWLVLLLVAPRTTFETVEEYEWRCLSTCLNYAIALVGLGILGWLLIAMAMSAF